ncbi:MAG: NusG domain II-containing protein [Ruminococcaceae bacterium]|nr:NusG domain II-containing protein [Oscillospiraceae bacterium]
MQYCSNHSGRKYRHDLLFIGGLLLIIAAASLALFLFRVPGDTVTVTVDGQVWGEFSLSENRTVEITGADGYNLLVIANGQAYVSEASCPDGICSSHRPISHDGESIICLPNRVVISVQRQDDRQPDIIS